jgi:hypothetical protein
MLVSIVMSSCPRHSPASQQSDATGVASVAATSTIVKTRAAAHLTLTSLQ